MVRLNWVSLTGITAYLFEIIATIGAGVVLGLMSFGFFGKKVGVIVGCITAIILLPYCLGFLRNYLTLLSSLTAYGASALVCTVITLLSSQKRFDFRRINELVVEFHSLSKKQK